LHFPVNYTKMNSFAVALLLASVAIFTEGAPHEDNFVDFTDPELTGDDSFIVGGEDVKLGELPYQVSLGGCGGSIISPLWVITAAHCVRNGSKGGRVRAGMVDIRDTNAQTRTVAMTFHHPNYTYRSRPFYMEHDLALLKLTEPFEFNDKVKAVALPKAGHRATGKILISGWGNAKRPVNGIMQKVLLDTIEQELCTKNHKEAGYTVPASSICAGDLSGAKSACHGDSGGPWVDNDAKVLVATVSWGSPSCNHPKLPNVSSQVSLNLGWIANTVKNNS